MGQTIAANRTDRATAVFTIALPVPADADRSLETTDEHRSVADPGRRR
jgi:hypothetical protein